MLKRTAENFLKIIKIYLRYSLHYWLIFRIIFWINSIVIFRNMIIYTSNRFSHRWPLWKMNHYWDITNSKYDLSFQCRVKKMQPIPFDLDGKYHSSSYQRTPSQPLSQGKQLIFGSRVSAAGWISSISIFHIVFLFSFAFCLRVFHLVPQNRSKEVQVTEIYF